MKDTVATDLEANTRELLTEEAAKRKWTRSAMLREIVEEWEKNVRKEREES